MNKSITILLLLLNFSYANYKQQSNTSKDIAKLEKPKASITNEVLTINDELYTLQIRIETSDNKQYLVFDMKLKNGSHFISPYAKRDFKGKFFMDLGSYKNISFDGNIIETPRSVEEVDEHPFVRGTVNWVRVNTTYKQLLNIKTNENFEVFGRVRFTIEPRCSLEEIPFAISYKNGVMKFIDPKC